MSNLQLVEYRGDRGPDSAWAKFMVLTALGCANRVLLMMTGVVCYRNFGHGFEQKLRDTRARMQGKRGAPLAAQGRAGEAHSQDHGAISDSYLRDRSDSEAIEREHEGPLQVERDAEEVANDDGNGAV